MQVLAAWTASTACILLYAMSKIRASKPEEEEQITVPLTPDAGHGVALPLTPPSEADKTEKDGDEAAEASQEVGR